MEMNEALQRKWVWHFMKRRDALGGKVIGAKYRTMADVDIPNGGETVR